MPTMSNTFSMLADLLVEEVPSLRREQLVPSAELFRDLGLDSIAMVNVMVAFEERANMAIDLLPWFGRAKATGVFTLQSIVDYVDNAVAEASLTHAASA
jgi:acyl carrier protein